MSRAESILTARANHLRLTADQLDQLALEFSAGGQLTANAIKHLQQIDHHLLQVNDLSLVVRKETNNIGVQA